MKRVLVVAGVWPWPPDQGDRVRLAGILGVLTRRAAVTLAAPPGPEPAPVPLEVVALPVRRRPLMALLHAGCPAAVGLRWDPALTRQVAALAGAADAVWVYGLGATAWLPPKPVQVPAVVDLVDALDRYYLGRWRHTGSPLWAWEAWKTRRWQARLARRWMLNVVSPADRAVLPGWARVWVTGNGCGAAGPPGSRNPEPGRAVTVGHWRYPPNAGGLRWFLRAVWPRVRRRVPGAVLDVVGKGAPGWAAGPGVRVRGWVPDLAAVYAAARVAVAPVLEGSGVKNKVLEALCHGVPVVTTPVGAEGLPPGPGLWVREGTEAWEEAVATALTTPAPPVPVRPPSWEAALAPLVEALLGAAGEG
ncbi:MAG: glycosyltransferase family 4 protein [Firmicutes bacterium]|nr:glycosyltransferase family 4 protein [Bacillota bacterium]